MKAIMVMFDSLNRHMLPPYGCDWVHAPNFSRLAEHTVRFTRSYVGSMPCMPARRELHTGRYNFLHRSWGPIEPFDDSMPAILSENGVYAHLVTDHYHYWEDGGATYHPRYSSFEIFRGQESDLWRPAVKDPPMPEHLGQMRRPDQANRQFMDRESRQPQTRTFQAGLDFMQENHDADNWFLQIETFDPHEPYYVMRHYRDLYPDGYEGPRFDWPGYGPVTETPEQVAHCRNMNAALVTMCDRNLGRVLDKMDALDLWEDTLLIVNTDHGFLLGEHDLWAKCSMPFYEEISHTPLFIWDPRCRCKGETRDSLVQTIDLAPTLLEFFGIERPPSMQGTPLRDTIARDVPVREAALFGIHGGHVNVTDGRYVYMRAPVSPENGPLYNYTYMPAHMRGLFSIEEFNGVTLAEPFTFTKGCRVMKIPAKGNAAAPGDHRNAHKFGTMLFDLENDPKQQNPLRDQAIEQRMIQQMVSLMRWNDAPPEQFERLGL